MKKALTMMLVLLLMISSGMMVFASSFDRINETLDSNGVYVNGKVIEIVEEVEERYYTQQFVRVKVLQGDLRGEILDLSYVYIENELNTHLVLEEGSKVTLSLLYDSEGVIKEIAINGAGRSMTVRNLVGIICLLVIVIGRWNGVKVILSIGMTLLGIVYILIPLIARGYSPVGVTIVISAIIILITNLLVTGYNNKTIAAVVGTTVGLIVAAIIGALMTNIASLTGLATEEAIRISYEDVFEGVNITGVLLAGIMISALGAIMDVSVSISSTINEVYLANKNLSVKELFQSGMNVGKDIMGTMCNTLILAYAGGVLPLMLLLMYYNFPYTGLINAEIIVEEITRALAGTIGLILTIPVTAYVASYLNKNIGQISLKKTNLKNQNIIY